ncbi:hypothetical protein ACWCQ0_51560 [Streptomyces massasporeus]
MPRHRSAAPKGASMSWAWRHSRRIAGVPAFVGCGPPRVADGTAGRDVPRPGGTAARGSVRGRVFPALAFAGFAAFRVAAVPLRAGGVDVRRCGDLPASGTPAPTTSRATGPPPGLPAGVPGSGSVSAISS